jgi:hypothetical protein
LIFKKNNKKTEDETELDDFKFLFPNKYILYAMFIIFNIFTIVSIYVASERSKILPTSIIISIIFLRYLYIFYNRAFGIKIDKFIKHFIGNSFDYFEQMYHDLNLDNFKNIFNSLLTAYLIFVSIYMIYLHRKHFKI